MANSSTVEIVGEVQEGVVELAGLLAGFGGMMVHAVFVNSLLYALMMGYLWVGLALLDSR